MTLKEICEKIQEIEQVQDVANLKYKDIEIWPLVRYTLMAHYLKSLQSTRKPKPGQSSSSRVFSFRKLLLHIKIVFRYYFKYLREKNLILLSGKLIFFCAPSDHSEYREDKLYCKFMDPFLEYLPAKTSYQKLVVNDAPLNLNPEKYYHKPIEVAPKHYFIFKRSLFHLTRPWFKRTITKELLTISKELPFQFPIEAFCRKLQDIIIYRDYFVHQIRKSKAPPRFVFFIAYYSTQTFGMALAAKRFGIRTVDIQHGKNGAFNPMRSHWTVFPKLGYGLLPDTFWTWGPKSMQEMKKWFPNEGQAPKLIVGGNPWIKRSTNKEFNIKNNTIFISSLKRFDKVILFALQNINNEIPSFIVEAIHKGPRDWIWLFRKHPMQEGGKNPILSDLVDLENVEVENTSAIQLFVLLSKVDVTITNWSSVAIEGLEFGVPAIIIHSEGRAMYQDYINEGSFKYVDDCASLLSALKKDIVITGYNDVIKNDDQVKGNFFELIS